MSLVNVRNDIDNYIKAYSVNEHGFEELFSLDNISSLIESLKANSSTKKVLREIYNILEPLQYRSQYLLYGVPRAAEQQVDLTLLEGSGFYENINNTWLYHKGGGSVEVLYIQEKLSLKGLIFPGFGVEYPNGYGAFGKVSLFAVKRLWQLVQEFSVSFSNLVWFIEVNNLSKSSQVIGKCCIPLSLIKLKALTDLINTNLASKPASIQAVYNNVIDSHQAAKIILCVPSPVRSTDKRYVRGKWVETENVFIRSLSSPGAKLHFYDTNPYWDSLSTYRRAVTIKNLLENGFINEIQSSHLQNFYFAESKDNNELYSLAADFCDFHLASQLHKSEIICLLSNLISGWRIAECLGPSWEATGGVSFEVVMLCINSFFEGLLGGRSNIISDLFVLLPQATSIAVSKLIYDRVNRKPQDNWNLISQFLGYKEELQSELSRVNDEFRKDIKSLFLTGANLRPKYLIDIILESVKELSNPISEELIQYSQSIQHSHYGSNAKNILFYFSKQLIELIFKSAADDCVQISKILNEKVFQQRTIEELHQNLIVETNRYFKKLINLKNIEEILWRLDEIFHINARVFGEWIFKTSSHENGMDVISHLMNKLHSVMTFLFVDPYKMIDDYLCYIFKKSGLFELLKLNDKIVFNSKINKKWDLSEETPIERKYLTLSGREGEFYEITKDLPVDSLVQQLVDVENIFHKIYVEAHED